MPESRRRWFLGVVAAGGMVLAACTGASAPTPVPTPLGGLETPSSSSAVASGSQADTNRIEMPNLGLSVDLPDGWQAGSDLTEDDLTTLQAKQPDLAALLRDEWWKVLEAPGSYEGLRAVDPTTGAVFVAELADADKQQLDLDALVSENRPPVAGAKSDVESIDVLGRDARRAVYLGWTAQGSTERRSEIVVLTHLTDGMTVRFLVTGPADAFDLPTAEGIIDTLAETGTTPLGKPFAWVRDRELEQELSPLRYPQVVSGDLVSLVTFDSVRGNQLFETALSSVPEFASNDASGIPASFRGASAGPGKAATEQFVEVSVVRSADAPAPTWAPMVDAFTTEGYADGKVGTCPAQVQPTTRRGRVAALIMRPAEAFWFYADAEPRIAKAAKTLLRC